MTDKAEYDLAHSSKGLLTTLGVLSFWEIWIEVG